MRSYLFFLFLSVYFYGFSQTDSVDIADKISKSEFSKTDMISKGRRLLLDEFEAGNMEEVKNIINYFDKEISDENHLPLWPAERLLLYYWTEDYNRIIDFSMYNLDSLPIRYEEMVVPTDRSIYQELMRRSDDEFDMLIDNSRKFGFSKDAEDFLSLLLESLLVDGETHTMEDLNKRAELFLSEHPESPLSAVVKKQIAYKLVPGNFVLGIYFGGGYAFSSGKLTDYFDPGGTVSMSVDFYYKKFAFFGMVNAGFGKLRRDILLGEDRLWEAGNRIQLASLGLDMGYTVFDNSKFRITPFGGVSFTSASTPSEQNDQGEYSDPEFELGGHASSVMFGMDITYRFYRTDLYATSEGSPQTSFGGNLRIVYVPSILNRKSMQYAGNTLFVTLGLNCDMFTSKRSSK